MSKIVEKIQVLKEKADTKKILYYAEILFYLYFFLRVCLNICYGVETPYQMNRDYYNFKAINYLLCIIIVATRAKIWHWLCILPACIYTVGCVMYMRKMMFEWEMFRTVEMRLLTYGLCGVILIDAIIRHNIVKWKERNIWLTGLLIFAFIITWFFSPGRAHTFFILCPFALIYLVKIKPEVWMKLIKCLSVSYVASVFWIFGKSLLEVPYEGERYYGVFFNIGTIGAFCGGAVVCVIYWLISKEKERRKVSLRMVLIFATLITSLVTVFMVGTRTVMFALICVVFFCYIFYPAKNQKGIRKKRIFIVCGVTSIMLCLGFLSLWGLYQIEREELRAIIDNDMLYNQIAYWHGRASTMFKAESVTFKHGTPIAMLDRFSSGRVGIWYDYIKNLNLLGHESEFRIMNEQNMWHAHNVFISCLYNYGIVGGGAFVCWLISVLIMAVKKATAKCEIYLFPTLWIVFALSAMLTETFYWIYPIPFIMLFLAYPFMNKMEEK